MIIPQPVLTSDEMAQLKRLDRASQLGGYYKPYVIRGLYQVTGGGNALETRLEEIFAEIDQAIADGSNFLVLSDRDSNHMICLLYTSMSASTPASRSVVIPEPRRSDCMVLHNEYIWYCSPSCRGLPVVLRSCFGEGGRSASVIDSAKSGLLGAALAR